MPTIGTCSKCNGPVQVPDLWGGTVPPVPTCAHCGATAKDPYGPTIPMEKRSCERCDAQGRCSSGTKYAWGGKGRVESPCACACHLSPVGVDDLAASLLDARERMISALGPKFGEAFDGDFDVMRDAAKALAQQPAAVDDADRDDARRYRALVATGKYVPAMREGWGLACGHSKASKAELDAAADALALAAQPAAMDGVLTPTGTFCSVCEAPQHNTPSGVSCPRGHGGAEPLATQPLN